MQLVHRDLSISILFPASVSVMRMAPAGHADTHSPQPLQWDAVYLSSGSYFCPSGLQHHLQRSGQPLRNTVVRMPKPSTKEPWTMLKTMPVCFSI